MEACSVIVITANVVVENILIVSLNNTNTEVGREAERVFLEKCKANKPDMDQEEIDASLDNGYFEFPNGSVCINWPAKTQI